MWTLPPPLGTLPTKCATHSLFQPFHISQCLHTNHGIFLLFHSNNMHHNFFVLRDQHFCLMNGCLWWTPFIKIWWHLFSHNGRSIFDIAIDPNIKARPKNTPQIFWVRGKRYSTDISEKCHVSWQKDKHIPWYLIYKSLIENWTVFKKSFNKTAKHIMQLSSQIFGRSTYFIRDILVYIILYSLVVLWYISLQEFLAANLYYWG